MWMEQGGKRMVGGRDGGGMWGCHELPGGRCGEAMGSGRGKSWGMGFKSGSWQSEGWGR